jgi:hypothetical protein
MNAAERMIIAGIIAWRRCWPFRLVLAAVEPFLAVEAELVLRVHGLELSDLRNDLERTLGDTRLRDWPTAIAAWRKHHLSPVTACPLRKPERTKGRWNDESR